jgi:hypothetical protein
MHRRILSSAAVVTGTIIAAAFAAVPPAIAQATTTTVASSSLTPSTLTLNQPASGIAGHQVPVSGTLLIGGDIPPDGTGLVTITMTGPAPAQSFAPRVGFGTFTWDSYPPVAGTYTYTATYAGNATTAGASASVTDTVTRSAPSFSLTVTPATASYEQAVHFNATLTNTIGSDNKQPVAVYAEPIGSKVKKKIASGEIPVNGSISGTAHFAQSVTLIAVYAGDPANAPVTLTKSVSVGARVTAAIRGYYATKKSGSTTYRLYHHTARLDLSATVAPVKKGECVEFQEQEYVSKAWRTRVTTGCVKLNSKSQGSTYLPVSKYNRGVPYRVRADYIRGNDLTNLAADSGFAYFMVEK